MKAAHAKNRLAHDLISSPSVLQERHLALRFMRATVLAQLPQYVIESLICPTEQVKFGKRVSSRSGHAPLHGVVLRILIRSATAANGRPIPAIICGEPGSVG
jgi:hypothetical protein